MEGYVLIIVSCLSYFAIGPALLVVGHFLHKDEQLDVD